MEVPDRSPRIPGSGVAGLDGCPDDGGCVAGELPRWAPRSIRVGDWTITALSDGLMRLDGGSMWGVVPRTLWQDLTPPAADNTIAIALRPFLCVRDDVVALIEVGVGDRWEPKWRSIYQLDRRDTLIRSLARLGVRPEDVTHVIASHCHFDHIGAQVVADGSGVLGPQFPRARHFAPAIEVAIAKRPDHVRRASYRADDVEPIERAGLLETFEGDAQPVPGIGVHPAYGHSDGLSVVTINADGEGDTAIFWTDVVPTTHHVQPAYIMAYDIDVVQSFESRSAWLERACAAGWIGLFYHDAEHAFGRLARTGRRYRVDVIPGAAEAGSAEAGSAKRGAV